MDNSVRDKLKKNFYEDIFTIASYQIASYEINYSKEINELSDPLMRWLDFRLRYISAHPRKILKSDIIHTSK